MNQQSAAAVWRFSDVELDERARELTVRGRLVEIEPKSFEVLQVLLHRAGEVVTIEEFQEAVWPGRIVAESAVTNIVSKLRRALEDDNQDIIKTVPRVGYRLAAAVERLASRRPEPTVPVLKAGDAVPGREQWRLAEPLAGGGYGDVWLAEHAKTREKRVFKFCTDSQRLSALKREVTLNRLLQDALGANDRYVRILEWNFESPPFFIESAYAGLNLAEWIASSGGAAAIPLAERFEAVATIADALGAAHSIAVLHKDLKPENVLIDEQRGQRFIRLADFGAGRLLDGSRLAELGITRLGFTQSTALDDSTTGTLLYLAPELVSGGSPSVQSDIYSLGVLLYQLIADKLGKPMAPGWESDIEDSLLRQDIIDATHGNRELRLPSAQLLAERLRSLPQRREELERNLQEQQRAAAARNALERSRARRPWLLAAMALLIVGFGTSSYFFLRERDETRQAREQAQIAEAFSDFVSRDILQAANPDQGGSVDIKLKDAVTHSVPEVANRFSGQPLIEASIKSTLAATLSSLDEYKVALTVAQDAARIYESQLGLSDRRTLKADAQLALLFLQSGRGEEANTLIDRVLASWKAIAPVADPDFLDARLNKLIIVSNMGSVPTAEAVELNQMLLADAEAAHMETRSVCGLKNRLIQNLALTHQTDEAEKLAKTFIPVMTEQCSTDSLDILEIRLMLGELEIFNREYDEAQKEILDLRRIFENRNGTESEFYVTTVEDEARLKEVQGLWQDALRLRKNALDIKVKTYGADDAMTLGPSGRYARDLLIVGKAGEALPLLDKAVMRARTELTPDESLIRSYLLLIRIDALLGLKRMPEAEQSLIELQQVADKAASDDVFTPAYLLLARADIAKSKGDLTTARTLAGQAAEAWKKGDSPQSPLFMQEVRAHIDLIATTN